MRLSIKILNALLPFSSLAAPAQQQRSAAQLQPATALNAHMQKDIGIDEGRNPAIEK